jgi:hypothetical protein
MTKNIFIAIIALGIMLAWLTSCDAELPPQHSVDVNINVVWDNELHTFRLTGDYDTQSEKNIIQKGFCYAETNGLREPLDYIETMIPHDETFECLLNDAQWSLWTKTYAFFAYVCTESGFYKSATITAENGRPRGPSIESVAYDPAIGELTIEGNGFSFQRLDNNSVYITYQGLRYEGEIFESSRTALRVKFYTDKHGVYSVQVVVEDHMYSNQVEFKIDGITIDSISPNPSYLGEEITIHTSGLSLLEHLQEVMYYDDYTIESISAHELKIRTYSEKHSIILIDKKSFRSNEFTLDFYTPWQEKVHFSDITYDQLSENIASAGKYVFYYAWNGSHNWDSHRSVLYCYDIATDKKKELTIKEESDEYAIMHPSPFVYKDYLYVIRQRYKPLFATVDGYQEPVFDGYEYLKHDMCRMSLSTGAWEWITIPEGTLAGGNDYIVNTWVDEANGIAYIRVNGKDILQTYDIENNTWDSFSLPIPESWWEVKFLGRHNDYFYYVKGSKLYKVKEGISAEVVYDLQPFMPEGMYSYAMESPSIVDGKLYFYWNYIYSWNYILFSVPLSDDMASQRPTSYGYNNTGNTYTRIVPYGDDLYIAGNAVWQFTR